MFGSKRRPIAGRGWLVAVVAALPACVPAGSGVMAREAGCAGGGGAAVPGWSYLACGCGGVAIELGGRPGAVRRRASGRVAALVAAFVFAAGGRSGGRGGVGAGRPQLAPSGANTVALLHPATTRSPSGGVSGASFDVFGAQGGDVLRLYVRWFRRSRQRRAWAHPRCTLTVVVGGRGGLRTRPSLPTNRPVAAASTAGRPAARILPGSGGGGASDVRMGGSALSTGCSSPAAAAGRRTPGHLGGGGGGLTGTAGIGGDPAGGGGSAGDQTGASGSGQLGAAARARMEVPDSRTWVVAVVAAATTAGPAAASGVAAAAAAVSGPPAWSSRPACSRERGGWW